MKTFYLPDLGEGLAEGEIVKWYVNVGETVIMDEPLVSIETAKAIVDVPAPYSGKIAKLYVNEGEIVPTGGALVDFEGTPGATSSTVVGEIKESDEIIHEQALSLSHHAPGIKVLPSVRALAKKMHVDLHAVTPTGSDNTITAEDVKKASQAFASSTPYEPLKGPRRTMALTMMQSHAEVVPVTVMDDVDVTHWDEKKDITVSMIQGIIHACHAEPALNAWYDGQAIARLLLKEIHIGLAVDTPDGLFMPVIHNVQKKTPKELRDDVEEAKRAVENRTISIQQLQGATIGLSNYGKFAGRYANPIIAVPMVAILGVGAIRRGVAIVNGQATYSKLLPLSLTVDHRAVTGGEATRFLSNLIGFLKSL